MRVLCLEIVSRCCAIYRDSINMDVFTVSNLANFYDRLGIDPGGPARVVDDPRSRRWHVDVPIVHAAVVAKLGQLGQLGTSRAGSWGLQSPES